MKIREAIRTLVEEFADEEIRRIVREVLIEELTTDENTRVIAAKKAAVTRRTNRESNQPEPNTVKVPGAARKLGIAVGQKYKSKDRDPRVVGRVIEVVALEKNKIVPKILSSTSKRAAAKRISYIRLQNQYDRIE
jgi:hypothetical protein